ncbi:MMPL family transporter [Gammaproteobacteria bacterium]|nr:MMPL family transporter [Gammaproteobacteria bacterium]
MQNDLFYKCGKVVYKFRWTFVSIWLALILSSIPFLPNLMDPFTEIGFKDPSSQSYTANTLLNKKLGYSYNQFIVMYSSDNLLATSSKYKKDIKESLIDVDKISTEHQIIYPSKQNNQISKNKHKAYAVILFKGGQEANEDLLSKFKKAIKEPKHLMMKVGGEPIFLEDTKVQTQMDMYSAEYIATPVAIITMLIVLGSVVSASIPIILGAISAFLTLFMLYILGNNFSLSVFTLNIALLVGLCLILDYSLLIINRFRDELHLGASSLQAVIITQATAGKAVFFSALAVLISLSALLFFKINILFSVGIGGVSAVLVAFFTAFFLLPAILGILGQKVNLLPIRWFKQNNLEGNKFCRWLVEKVVKYKYGFFTISLIFLLMVGYPFLNVKYGISDFKILPKASDSRQVYDTFAKDFGESKLFPILAIIESKNGPILTKSNLSYLYDYAKKIQKDYRVDQVRSIVSLNSATTKEQYHRLYSQPTSRLPKDIKNFMKISTNGNFTVLTITSKYPSFSDDTTSLIKNLRISDPGNGMSVKITGTSANTIDVLNSIGKTFPYSLLWIVFFSYIALLVVLRSIILPLKAILTTMLSLFASYGVLVLVFQMGYFHELLVFEPQGMLDISLLIIIFCTLFGISMDYEVFLLARIKECHEQTGDNIKSIIFGIDRSWKIITSAAIIVILLCFSFMSADVLIVKAFGLGIAIAVFIDAYIIRTILVPATMAILKKWNWYLPDWLDKLLPKISFDTEQNSKVKQFKIDA